MLTCRNMRRVSSFVVLDVVVTVPFILLCTYSYFFGADDPGQWFWWVFVGCAGAVLFPSVVFFMGRALPHGVAAGLICLYLLILPVLLYGLVYKLHTGAWNVIIYLVLIVAVSKSVYSACMVTKSHD